MGTRKSRKTRKTLTVRFLYRTILALTVFSCGLAFFFFFGNIQQFLDSTQILILSILSVTATATILAAIPLVIPELILAVTRRRQKYLHILVFSIICVLISAIFAVVSHTILMLSAGM